MAPPKDIARSYPKRGLTADVGFRSEPTFCGDGSAEFAVGESAAGTYTNTLNSTLSMCCWVKSYSVQQTYFMDLGVNSSKAQISISYHNGTGVGQNKRPYIWNGSVVIYATQEMEINEWHHLAVTSAPGAGNIKIYLDGVDVTPSHSTDVNITTNNIYLGKWIPGSGNFNGKMANAALFRTTLTQEQVRECMRASSFSQFDAISTLEAFYPLDANFNDSTSGGHDLTVTGSPSFTVDRPQLPRGLDLARGAAMARVYTGRCVDFDGSADYLRNSATVPSITGAGAQASICAWVNFDSASGGLRNIASFCNTSNDDGIVIYQNNAEIGVAVFNNAPTIREKALTSVSTGRWFFVVGTWDKDTASQKVYVDGVRGSGNMSIGIGIEAGTDIGARSSATPQYYFDGQIASVKYFDVELTQAQVRELYHNPEQVLPTGVSASNLRRYYPLSDYNDATAGGMGGRYFQDMGADGEPAEDKGSSSMAFAQPVPCPQLGLQQSATRVYFERNSTRAQANLGAAPGATCTMSAWVMVDEQFPYQYFMKNGTSIGTNEFFAFAVDTNRRLYAVQYSSVEAESSLQLSDYGEWNHVVAMTKSTAPYVRFFINGVEDTSITDNGMVAFNLTSTFIEIGSDGGNHLKGFLNDCAIWDVELSDPEVAALYNSGVQGMDVSTVQPSNLKGWWKCDDLTTFKDYSGNGVNAALTTSINAASFPENASGSTIVGDFSMKRKGVSILNINNDQGYAYALGQDKPSYFPKAGATGYTMSVAHRPIKTGITEIFWGNDITVGTTPTNDEFILFMNPNGSYQWQLGDGSSRPSAVSAAGVADGEWHIITLTIDYSVSPANWKIYVDGVSSATGTAAISGPPGNFYEVSFGRWRSGGYKGSSASGCYRFYDVALSADEVKRLAFSDLRLIKGLANE